MPKKWLESSLKLLAVVLLTIPALVFLRSGRISAQDMPVAIGRIEGDDVEVKTTTAAGMEMNDAPTVVGSGSDVTLRSGHALIALNGGGAIGVCGPAHFTLLKSGGAVTLALDYGRVHPSLVSPDSLTIYTPTIIATPMPISGAARDVTLGLNESGEMCILAARGAMRVEPQFSGQSLIVPQGGAATLESGQILAGRGNPAACSCDFSRASLEHSTSQPTSPPSDSTPLPAEDIGTLSRPSQSEPRMPDVSTPPATEPQEPTFTVLMPPLRFDANSPIPAPDPSPETILLVRQVRLRPTAVFRGHVDPAPVQKPQTAPPVPASPPPSSQQPVRSHPDMMSRMWNFLRGIAGKTP